MMQDTINLDTPAGKSELKWLEKQGVGEVTESGVLLPALQIPLEWICTSAKKHAWEFDVQFCGQLLFRATFVKTDTSLVLSQQGV